MSSAIHIVRTGSANLASVAAAIERARFVPIVTDDPDQIEQADLCILPGVGAFGPAMETLRRCGLATVLIERFNKNRPLLAICLGLQLLLEGSEEAPGQKGLGVIPGIAKRFENNQIVPHMGWNQVVPRPGFDINVKGWAWFANSYRLIDLPPDLSVAITDYGGPFVSAVQKSPVIVACQFHPELSGNWGAKLIQRWISASVPMTQKVRS